VCSGAGSDPTLACGANRRHGLREQESCARRIQEGVDSDTPFSIVIVGGGAAGLAAAEMLRREGFSGPVTMVSADSDPPCDRPNLSKDFLAGTAPEDWIPLRPQEWYSQQQINLALNSRVISLDTNRKEIATQDGKTYPYEALLMATGADPVELPIGGAAPSQISYLR
jgi:apoptosis-inducing factor 3